MRIHALAAAVLIVAAPAASMANTDRASNHVVGETTSIQRTQPNTGSATFNGSDIVQSSRYWRCPRRRGRKVTHMTFRRGKSPLCHYRKLRRLRVSYYGRGYRVTRNAWRHCRRKYGKRVVRALESRTKYRCIFRR